MRSYNYQLPCVQQYLYMVEEQKLNDPKLFPFWPHGFCYFFF